MKFGNYTPTETDSGNGLTGPYERHLFQFGNGLTASVCAITSDIVNESPDTYKPEEAGTWELAVTVHGLPLPLLEAFTGQHVADPLGSDVGESDPAVPDCGLRWNLSETDVATLLARVESAGAVEAA